MYLKIMLKYVFQHEIFKITKHTQCKFYTTKSMIFLKYRPGSNSFSTLIHQFLSCDLYFGKSIPARANIPKIS